MTHTLAPAVTRVSMEIDRLKRFYPELLEDLELLAGMVEGQTDFDPLLDAILAEFIEAASFKDALSLQIEAMKTRAGRFDKKADALRELMMTLMQSAEKTMARRPLATVVRSKGRSVLQLDDDFNAQGYMRVRTEPMKADILAALKAGNEIPGARLVEGEPGLSVRTK